MIARRLTTMIAWPCAIGSFGTATAQIREAGQVREARAAPIRLVPAAAADMRLPVLVEPQRARLSTIQSWAVGADGEVSLGRFRVVDQARRRTYTERERAPLLMEAETRGIAGAGFRWRF